MVIFVSLRMAASAVTPSAPIKLCLRLRARDKMGHSESVGVSMGADTKANTLAGAVHLRSAIFVSLSTAAIAVTPLSLIPLFARLRSRGRVATVSE